LVKHSTTNDEAECLKQVKITLCVLSITTYSIMTLSTVTFGILTVNIKAHSIMTLSIKEISSKLKCNILS
jgi:hypothetical protein